MQQPPASSAPHVLQGTLTIPLREIRRCRRLRDTWTLKRVHRTGHRSGRLELELIWGDLLDFAS